MPRATVTVSMLCDPPIPSRRIAEQAGERAGALQSVRWQRGERVTRWTWQVDAPTVSRIQPGQAEAAIALAVHEVHPRAGRMMIVGFGARMDPDLVVLPEVTFAARE